MGVGDGRRDAAVQVVTLPPKVQPLIDELRRVLGLHPFDVAGFEVNLDRDGIVQDVKPKLIYRREKLDTAGT